MNAVYAKKIILVSVMLLLFSGFASSYTMNPGNLNKLNIATTTTQPANSDVRCEAVTYPSANTCVTAICPDGYNCKYVPSSTAAANIGTCKCVSDTTTTSTTLQTRCEAVKLTSANSCEVGLCPQGAKCKFVQSAAMAAVIGSCKCVYDTTTTTLPPNGCESITPANANTCVKGTCIEGFECKYSSVAGAIAAVVGKCRCVPKQTTTTTLTSLGRCESTSPANEKTCVNAACPQGSRCKYVPSAAAANVGYCKCISDSTTTTIQPSTGCEGIEPVSASKCVAGLCPEGTRCRFRPASVTALSYSQHPSCVCVQDTTTTTLYPSCRGIIPASRETCLKGACPPNTVCRMLLTGQATALVANLPASGSCDCVPCTCDSTTTTIPTEVLCERVVSPSAKTCEEAKCPAGQKCKAFTAVVGNGEIRKCACIGETTTTLPPVSCEGLISGSADKCAQAKCPEGYRCKFSPGTTANSVGVCNCVQDTTPTTVQGPVSCENVANPSANTCEKGKCPEGQKCRVFTYTYSNGQVSKCACVGETTSTTIQPSGCEALTNANANTCASGACPEGFECKYYSVVTGAANIGKCACVPKQTTTTLPQGILNRLLRGIFG